MKKKKGFTLIELLAVIVILAIITLIATPMVLNIIKASRKGAALNSARNYIKAYNTYLIEEQLDYNLIEDVIYYIDEKNNAITTGNGPISGIIKVEDYKVVEARLYINGYSVDKEDADVKISNNDYSFSGDKKIFVRDENNTRIYAVDKNLKWMLVRLIQYMDYVLEEFQVFK